MNVSKNDIKKLKFYAKVSLTKCGQEDVVFDLK